MNEWFGLVRSLVVYWRPGRQRALRALYAEFVRPGDLVFDIGAHVGDRTVAFAALGARVVALEPQARFSAWLGRIAARRPSIVVRREAVGPGSGSGRLAVSSRNPTVSTLSEEWRRDVSEANPGFEGIRWDRSEAVSVVTLDALIEDHGEPRFCKIDVEGYEAEVLAGLGRPLEALSFEFVAGGLEIASACLDRLEELSQDYEYNVILGEGRQFEFEDWMDATGARRWIEAGAGSASSGDVYARRRPR